MKNQIKILNTQEILVILNELKINKSCYILELDGAKIQSWVEYIEHVSKVLDFPQINNYSKDGYIDWMTDLSWLEWESCAVIIYNFSKFMNGNLKDKEEVIDMFKTDILPFWEEEVTYVTTGGYPKEFNVYLVA